MFSKFCLLLLISIQLSSAVAYLRTFFKPVSTSVDKITVATYALQTPPQTDFQRFIDIDDNYPQESSCQMETMLLSLAGNDVKYTSNEKRNIVFHLTSDDFLRDQGNLEAFSDNLEGRWLDLW